MERMSRPHRAHRLAQESDLADQQIAAAVSQVDGKEVCGARNTGASVFGHGGSSLSIGCVKQGGPAGRWYAIRSHLRTIDAVVGWMTLCSSTIAMVSAATRFVPLLIFRVGCSIRSALLGGFLLAVARMAGPAKRNQKGLPPTSGLALRRGSLAPSSLQGPAYKGRPGPLRLSPHPCGSLPSTTIPFGLLKGAGRCLKVRVARGTG